MAEHTLSEKQKSQENMEKRLLDRDLLSTEREAACGNREIVCAERESVCDRK